MEPVTPQEQPEIEQPKATYTDKDSDKKEKSAIPYLIATIIIVLLLCGGAILFIYYPDLFSSSSDKNVVDIPEVTQPVQPEAQLSDTIAHKDTVVEAVQPQPVARRNRQRNLSKQKVNLPNNNQQLRHIWIPHPTR